MSFGRRFRETFIGGATPPSTESGHDKQPKPDAWQATAMERIQLAEDERILDREGLKAAGVETVIASVSSKEPVRFTFSDTAASPSVRCVQGMASATKRGSWRREVDFGSGIGNEYGPAKSDKANTLRHVLTGRPDGMVLLRSSVEYDEAGSLVRQRVLNYDQDGRLVNASLVDADGNVLEEQIHTYGEDGILRNTELVQYNHPDAEGQEVEYTTVYTPPHEHEKDSIMWMSDSTLSVSGEVRKDYNASEMTQHLGKEVPQKHPVSGIPAGTASTRLWL